MRTVLNDCATRAVGIDLVRTRRHAHDGAPADGGLSVHPFNQATADLECDRRRHVISATVLPTARRLCSSDG